MLRAEEGEKIIGVGGGVRRMSGSLGEGDWGRTRLRGGEGGFKRVRREGEEFGEGDSQRGTMMLDDSDGVRKGL